MTRAAAHALGLKLFASTPCAALTAIVPPGDLDSGVIVKAFRESFAAVVANGQGEMKGKLFRIAHLGYYDYMDTIGVIAGLEQILARTVSEKQAMLGAGVRAAQMVYAHATAAVHQESAAKS
jgi:aspartate aminotransferase-like enzyme